MLAYSSRFHQGRSLFNKKTLIPKLFNIGRLKPLQKLFVKDFESMIKYCVRLRWLPLN